MRPVSGKVLAAGISGDAGPAGAMDRLELRKEIFNSFFPHHSSKTDLQPIRILHTQESGKRVDFLKRVMYTAATF